MKFNYFRILVTILASFAAFFAYVCRLNLSLSIEHMTVRHSKSTSVKSSPQEPDNDTNLKHDSSLPQQQTTQKPPTTTPIDSNELQNLVYKLPPIYNEEHSFAWISRGKVIISKRPKAALLDKVDLEGRNRSILIRGTEINSNVLSIDVDRPSILSVDGKTANRHENIDGSGSNVATGNDEQPSSVDDGPKIEPASPDGNLLDWSEQDKNDVLGAFFYGYVFLQIPSARAAEMFGAKSLLLLCGIGTGLCSLIFPFAAKISTSIWPAQLVRLIMGACQGALFPVCYVFLCEWLPRNERSSWLPFPSAFSRIGTIVMNLILPIIIKNYDWETVFYVSGIVTLTWCVVFLVFGSNSPSQSYWISKQELIYIESHMEPRIGTLNKQSDVSASGFTINEPAVEQQQQSLSKPSIDWMKILTNRPILILSLVMFLSDWSNFILLVKLPGFLIPALEMDLVEVGFWSSVLVAIFFVMYPLAGFCAQKVEQHFDSLNSLQVRKIFEAVAHLLQAAGCLLIAFSDDRTLVIVALCMMMVGRATVGGGQCLMPPELSKEYPGTVFAFCNTLANLSGIIGPKIATWLVADPCEHKCWFSLFVSSAVMFAIGGFVFCLFADNQLQDIAAIKSSAGNKKKPIAMSQAQLTVPGDQADDGRQQVAEMFKMDAFPRVMGEQAEGRHQK